MFNFRIVLFLYDIVGIFVDIYLLAYALPRCAPQMVDFFRDYTKNHRDVGYICSFADFDLGSTSAPRAGTAARTTLHTQKMEHSLLSFAANHPNWTPGAGSRAVIDDAAARLQPVTCASFHSEPSLRRPTKESEMDLSVLSSGTGGYAGDRAFEAVHPELDRSLLLDEGSC